MSVYQSVSPKANQTTDHNDRLFNERVEECARTVLAALQAFRDDNRDGQGGLHAPLFPVRQGDFPLDHPYGKSITGKPSISESVNSSLAVLLPLLERLPHHHQDQDTRPHHRRRYQNYQERRPIEIPEMELPCAPEDDDGGPKTIRRRHAPQRFVLDDDWEQKPKQYLPDAVTILPIITQLSLSPLSAEVVAVAAPASPSSFLESTSWSSSPRSAHCYTRSEEGSTNEIQRSQEGIKAAQTSTVLKRARRPNTARRGRPFRKHSRPSRSSPEMPPPSPLTKRPASSPHAHTFLSFGLLPKPPQDLHPLGSWGDVKKHRENSTDGGEYNEVSRRNKGRRDSGTFFEETTSGSSEPSANGSKKNNQVQNQLSISAAANATDRKNAKSDAIIVSTPMATERSEAAIEVTNDVTVQKGLIVSMSRDSTFSEDEHTADLLEQWRANLENCPAQSSHTSTPTSILAPIPTSITDRVQSKEYEEPCQQDTTDTNLPVSKRKVDSLYGSRRSSMAPIPHKRRKRGARDRRAGQEVGTMKNMGPMSSIADIIRSELDDSVILKRAVETVATIDTTDLTKESDTSKENEVEMEKENVSSEVDMAMHPEQSAQITQIDIEEAKRRVEALCQSYTIVSNTSNKGASVEIEEGEIVETAAPTNSLKGDQYNMRSIGIRTEIEPASSSESMSAFERVRSIVQSMPSSPAVSHKLGQIGPPSHHQSSYHNQTQYYAHLYPSQLYYAYEYQQGCAGHGYRANHHYEPYASYNALSHYGNDGNHHVWMHLHQGTGCQPHPPCPPSVWCTQTRQLHSLAEKSQHTILELTPSSRRTSVDHSSLTSLPQSPSSLKRPCRQPTPSFSSLPLASSAIQPPPAERVHSSASTAIQDRSTSTTSESSSSAACQAPCTDVIPVSTQRLSSPTLTLEQTRGQLSDISWTKRRGLIYNSDDDDEDSDVESALHSFQSISEMAQDSTSAITSSLNVSTTSKSTLPTTVPRVHAPPLSDEMQDMDLLCKAVDDYYNKIAAVVHDSDLKTTEWRQQHHLRAFLSRTDHLFQGDGEEDNQPLSIRGRIPSSSLFAVRRDGSHVDWNWVSKKMRLVSSTRLSTSTTIELYTPEMCRSMWVLWYQVQMEIRACYDPIFAVPAGFRGWYSDEPQTIVPSILTRMERRRGQTHAIGIWDENERQLLREGLQISREQFLHAKALRIDGNLDEDCKEDDKRMKEKRKEKGLKMERDVLEMRCEDIDFEMIQMQFLPWRTAPEIGLQFALESLEVCRSRRRIPASRDEEDHRLLDAHTLVHP